MKRIHAQADHRRGEQLPAIARSSVVAIRFPSKKLMERTRFVMATLLVEMVRQGQKRSTIRFTDKGIEYPASDVLPIYALKPGQPHDAARYAIDVRVESVAYVRCRDLSDADAREDGFRDSTELITALKYFYAKLEPDSLVTIYRFAVPQLDAAHYRYCRAGQD
jgi:hypothetical protein